MHIQSLQNDDCFAIRRAARQVSQFYERYLSGTGVTLSQYSVLAVLAQHSGLTMARLSTVLEVERTTVLRTLKPILKTGFVAGRYERKVRRRLVFDLTEIGRQKLAEVAAHWQSAHIEFERKFGLEQAARLRAELIRMTDELATI